MCFLTYSIPECHGLAYLCEGITVCDAIACTVHTQVHALVQVLPVVGVTPVILGQTMALDQLSLGYPRILHRRLRDEHAVVLQVVVDDHRTNAVLLIRRVQHFLLKVSIETQHLEQTRDMRMKKN